MLTLGRCHGSQLAAEIGARSGEPAHPGQVAKTLARLEAEGLVAALEKDASGRIPYELTGLGRAEAAVWLDTPAIDAHRIAIAGSLPGVDREALLAAQHAAVEEIVAALPDPRPLAEPPRRGRPART